MVHTTPVRDKTVTKLLQIEINIVCCVGRVEIQIEI